MAISFHFSKNMASGNSKRQWSNPISTSGACYQKLYVGQQNKNILIAVLGHQMHIKPLIILNYTLAHFLPKLQHATIRVGFAKC